MTEKILKAHFSGRVQGVGFRAYVYGISKGFSVTGWVKNLPDGRVELVACGDEKELVDFLNSIRNGQMAANIHEVKSDLLLPQQQNMELPRNFQIR
jgi:acylphosphatase